MDNIYVDINTIYPVFLSLSTIPPRIENTVKIVKNILKHVSGFEKLVLNVPLEYKNYAVSSPKFRACIAELHNIRDSRFILNRPDDKGPITKLYGALDLIPDECVLLIFDDDSYHHEAFKIAAETQDRHTSKSFTFWKYTLSKDKSKDESKDKIDVPQGVDIISFWSQNLRGIKEYIDKTSVSFCFYVDDLIIGKFLHDNEIPVEVLKRKWKWPFILASSNTPGLFEKKGKYSRENATKKCLLLL